MSISSHKIMDPWRQSTSSLPFGLSGAVFIVMLFVAVPLASDAVSQPQQKGSSIVIHDTTTARNGGESATQSLRNEIESALEKAKPCVETIDDQDIRDTIQDEREREMLEGGDPSQALQNLGERLGSSLVMSVQAMPGPNGSVVFSVFVMDTKTGRTIAREIGSDAKQLADKLVGVMASSLADNCKPHWSGTIEYVYSFNETKQESDGGAAHAARRKVSRTTTTTSKMQSNIKASLLPPTGDKSVNSPSARVSQRVNFIFDKRSNTSGEQLCREPGKNSYFKGFSEEYGETTTQLGQGTGTMPVFIAIDSDGSYTINVTAPGGVLMGKLETTRSNSSCGSAAPAPTTDAVSMPEGKLQSTSFEATGRTDPKNRDVLAGTQTSPDGRTKITWKLRLVKPKGKG